MQGLEYLLHMEDNSGRLRTECGRASFCIGFETGAVRLRNLEPPLRQDQSWFEDSAGTHAIGNRNEQSLHCVCSDCIGPTQTRRAASRNHTSQLLQRYILWPIPAFHSPPFVS